MTATSKQHLLDAIAADPGALAPRLIFADWLEEHGSPLCHEWRKPSLPPVRAPLIREASPGGAVFGVRVATDGDGAGAGRRSAGGDGWGLHGSSGDCRGGGDKHAFQLGCPAPLTNHWRITGWSLLTEGRAN